MKKTILTAAIISLLMIGCKDTKSTNPDGSSKTEMTQENNKMALNNDWVKDIQLDNGNKWEANMETTVGVEKMLDLIKNYNFKTVEDYHIVAKDLNEVKNYVVKECTMKGASHDNLHVFLYPLIEKIEVLGKVSTVDEGSKAIDSIHENLEKYYQYFK